MIPELVLGALERYRDQHLRPGSCLCAVLAGDLFDAFSRADPATSAAMGDIVRWICRGLPGNAWGSREAVDAWVARGAMRLATGEVA
jgi:hypothetical protein